MNEETAPIAADQSQTYFWRAFWLAIGLFLAIYIYANWLSSNTPKFVKNKDGSLSIVASSLAQFRRELPALRTLTKIEIAKARPLIHRDIERELNRAYAPVYDQIPKFAEFHYSLKGEYSEILAAMTGSGAHSLSKMLFEDTGFGARHQTASKTINAGALGTVQTGLQKVKSALQEKLDLSQSDSNLISDGFHLTSASLEARFTPEMKALRGGSVLTAVAATKFAAKKISLAIGKKVATKVAIKTGVKAIAPLLAGAKGAAACSWGGLVGWVVCGVGAAAFAWVVTDKIIIELDEVFNRDSFEADLRHLLDKQKAELRTQLIQGYDKFLDKVSDSVQTRMIKASTPFELLAK